VQAPRVKALSSQKGKTTLCISAYSRLPKSIATTRAHANREGIHAEIMTHVNEQRPEPQALSGMNQVQKEPT